MIRTPLATLKILLHDLGVRSGHTVMIHSALFSLGLIEGGIKGFYDTVMECLGPDGTLIVPTFTYSFRRDELFDVQETPSAVNIGVFSEFVRKQPEAVRCPDPLFSMAAIGPKAAHYMQRDGHACFGANSPYARLFDDNITFVAIGITYSTGLTGFLHIEHLAQVPYRLDILYTGTIRGSDGTEYTDSAMHYARNEDIYGATITDREPMGLAMEAAGVSTAVPYGHGKHMSLRGQDWLGFVGDQLTRNIYTMLDSSQYPHGIIPE